MAADARLASESTVVTFSDHTCTIPYVNPTVVYSPSTRFSRAGRRKHGRFWLYVSGECVQLDANPSATQLIFLLVCGSRRPIHAVDLIAYGIGTALEWARPPRRTVEESSECEGGSHVDCHDVAPGDEGGDDDTPTSNRAKVAPYLLSDLTEHRCYRDYILDNTAIKQYRAEIARLDQLISAGEATAREGLNREMIDRMIRTASFCRRRKPLVPPDSEVLRQSVSVNISRALQAIDARNLRLGTVLRRQIVLGAKVRYRGVRFELIQSSASGALIGPAVAA